MSEQELPSDNIGRYRVVRLLGHGAMGRVLLARDPVLDRDVAVKLLRQDLNLTGEQHEALVERMRQEARASARLLHPNIVALFDMGEEPGIGLYLVFEYVEGPTLEQEIARGPLGARRTTKLGQELGSALSTAHRAGVLHRDIKPANVILAETGAKIADFGIARIAGSTLTLGGSILGTPAYSAPEAIATGSFSPASDEFSLAATLYEALSAERAFPGDDAVAVAARIRESEPDPVAARHGLHAEVDRVLARGLAKEPGQRYPSADELGAALAEALGEPHTGPTDHDARGPPDEAPPAWLGVAIGAVIGAAITASLFLLASERNSPAHAFGPGRTAAPPALSAAASTELPARRVVPRARPPMAVLDAGREEAGRPGDGAAE